MNLGRRALARRLLAFLLPAGLLGIAGGRLARGDLVISRGWVLRRDDLAAGPRRRPRG